MAHGPMPVATMSSSSLRIIPVLHVSERNEYRKVNRMGKEKVVCR